MRSGRGRFRAEGLFEGCGVQGLRFAVGAGLRFEGLGGSR